MHHHHHSHHSHNHSTPPKQTRRHFLSSVLGAGLAGATLVEVSFIRAALARAQSRQASTDLFDIEQVTDGVFCAVARPATMINCNASIFENSRDLLVVDTHSKASAAAALIAQIRREVSEKPVRYIVNSHFHWDHGQGTSAYRQAFTELDIVASEPTKRLMNEHMESRLEIQLEQFPELIDEAERSRGKATNASEKAFYEGEISQLQAYRSEMRSFSLELPTITFRDSYVIKDASHDLHLSFRGRGHTSGDVIVQCPQKNILATGDLIHGFFPYIADGYPREWPATIDSIGRLEFGRILPGHGPVQTSRGRMVNLRNYLEELTGRVADGKKAGREAEELQASITVSSLRTMAADGYSDYLAQNIRRFRSHYGPNVDLQEWLNTNIQQVYETVDKV